MIKRIEEKLKESPLLCAIAKGVAFALAVAMFVMAAATGLLALHGSVAWLIVFLLCALVCGASFGIAAYLDR